MHKLRWLVALAALTSGASCFGVTNTHDGAKGFIGYGITLYEPFCAWPCLYAITSPINCTDEDLANTAREKRSERSVPDDVLQRREAADAGEPVYPSGTGWQVTAEPTRQCQSRNEYFMKTAAYCLQTRCSSLPLQELEAFYEKQFPGPNKSALAPEYHSYSTLVATVTSVPTQPLNASVILDYTAYIPDETYNIYYNTMYTYAKSEKRGSWYAMVVFVSGAIIPIGVSMLRFLPWPQRWLTKFHAFIIDPPLVGTKHDTPVWGLGVVPTRGQAILLLYMWVINVVATVQGIDYAFPSSRYSTPAEAYKIYVANRTGVMSCALFPLVMLYAGRNNLLLWLTNWSHATFLLIHRWTAVLCMLHAVVHGALYLDIALLKYHGRSYAEQSAQRYWQLGAASLLAMVILCLISVQIVRRKAYELFLVLHILLAVVALAGAFYHINLKYTSDYGYENWLIMALAVWAFDRAMRLARSLRHGVKRAYLSPIDDEYYRLDIPNLSASGHVYLHFPTISSWRVWENHPFSVATVSYRKSKLESTVQMVETKEMAKNESTINTSRGSSSAASESEQTQVEQPESSGVVLFVRKHAGMTALLAKRRAREKGVPVLVEGSYDIGSTFLQDQHPTPTHDYPNLICIAGGVGITGVLSALDHFNNTAKPCGTRKLLWGVRTMPLVHAVESMLGYDCGRGLERRWGNLEVTLSVGQRFNLRHVLEKELRVQRGGTTVVVCGPTSMADDVRYIVSALARHSGGNEPILVKLAIESFSW
ncbi:ferric-chelate reductase (Fre2) [Metarhizium acridum CQMa 102]|uniref:Ferric-chelate reductase (Fre2) n=1 Tax=Metarhizium acridum (strain CQMa 102) TaxID=655827 RepID=E9DXC6_METAQ|nr:ferric-chelate reductase (Fre2) [Metarhizium acridum CQMa 102]EFY91684.1 ferric-chelate reductase (Fre2) [Metarhizium acridum CQMa 102]